MNLSAVVWKVIKGWLPAAGIKKIRFDPKASIGEFLRAEDRLNEWGGEFVHENRFDPGPEASMMTATEISGNVKEAKSDSNGSPASAGLAASFDPAGGLLKLGPLGKDVVINRNGYGELVAS